MSSKVSTPKGSIKLKSKHFRGISFVKSYKSPLHQVSGADSSSKTTTRESTSKVSMQSERFKHKINVITQDDQ